MSGNELPCRDKRGTNTGYRRHMIAVRAARDAGLDESSSRPCRECKDARAAWQRRYLARRYVARGGLTLDPVGTQRRLQALAAVGWSFPELGRRLGMSGSAVSKMASRSGSTRRATAEKVAALYDELSMIPGGKKISVTRARMKGWVPPLGWDDEDIDDPRATPQGVRVTE